VEHGQRFEFVVWRGRLPALAERSWRRLGLRHETSFGEFRIRSDIAVKRPLLIPYCALSAKRGLASLADAGDCSGVQLTAAATLRARRALSGGPAIFHHHRPGLSMLSTRLEPFAAVLGLRQLNELALAVWFSGTGTFPQGESMLDGVQALEPGDELELTGLGVSTHTWWTPPRRRARPPSETQQREDAAELLDALRESLMEQLGEVGNLTLLSGGVDSSLLTSLALSAGAPLGALTYLPKPHGVQAVRERSFAQHSELASKLAWHELVELTESSLCQAVRDAPPRLIPPTYTGSLLLPKVLQQHPVQVVVRGDFADEGFGARLRLEDWAEGSSPARILLRPKHWPQGPLTPVRWLRRRIRRARGVPRHFPPARLAPLFSDALQQRYSVWREEFEARLQRSQGNGLLRWDARSGSLAEAWETGTRYGIQTCFPFMSQRAVELAYRLHPNALLSATTKPLLRQAAQGHLPELHRLRTDKGGSLDYSCSRIHAFPNLAEQTERLLCPRWLSKSRGERLTLRSMLLLLLLEHMVNSLDVLTDLDSNDERQEPATHRAPDQQGGSRGPSRARN
jgi:asparagine synthetase B (glutamine-hydrolysing)